MGNGMNPGGGYMAGGGAMHSQSAHSPGNQKVTQTKIKVWLRYC